MSVRSRRRGRATKSTVALPSDKAFVILLARSTDAELKSFAGRIEHLASGRRLRFESVAQFLMQVGRLLDAAEESTDAP